MTITGIPESGHASSSEVSTFSGLSFAAHSLKSCLSPPLNTDQKHVQGLPASAVRSTLQCPASAWRVGQVGRWLKRCHFALSCLGGSQDARCDAASEIHTLAADSGIRGQPVKRCVVHGRFTAVADCNEVSRGCPHSLASALSIQPASLSKRACRRCTSLWPASVLLAPLLACFKRLVIFMTFITKASSNDLCYAL